MNIVTMAWRNVLRHRRRSVVTIGAMAFALCIECLYSGLIPGYMNAMLEDITQLEVGDLQIHAEGYRTSHSIYTVIEDPAVALAAVEGLGYAGSARLLGGGLGASGEYSAGVALRGVDVARDARVCRVSERIAAGQWLDPADREGVVLGRGLARTLNAEPGSELLLLSQATDGSVADALFTVRGVLGSVAEATDRATVYMTEEAFRGFFEMPTGAHEIVVKVPPKTPLPEAAAALTAALPNLDVRTWKQLMPIIAQMLDSVQGVVFVMYFIIYAAVGILVLNAVLMAVFERIREFGVLKAIGAGPGRVLGLILLENAIQTLIAIALGLAAALPGMWWIGTRGLDFGSIAGMNMMGVSMRKTWYGVYDVPGLAGPVIALVVVVSLAVAYPALKAAWVNPVRAMRYR